LGDTTHGTSDVTSDKEGGKGVETQREGVETQREGVETLVMIGAPLNVTVTYVQRVITQEGDVTHIAGDVIDNERDVMATHAVPEASGRLSVSIDFTECRALVTECRALLTECRALLTECRALLTECRALSTECGLS